MKIVGIDFTSAPGPVKPITVAICRLHRYRIQLQELRRVVNFQGFALTLSDPGPWISALDFPLGQPRQLIETLAWPRSWAEYVYHVASLGKGEFRATLDAFRRRSPAGSKEHLRHADRLAGAISPMKLYGVPVGMMFCQGAPFVLASQASVLPFLPNRDASRIVIEGYPKLVVSKLFSKLSYKTDDPAKISSQQASARRDILAAITDSAKSSLIRQHYGVSLECPPDLAEICVQDPAGDFLDAVLCCFQAAWAWRLRESGYGMPQQVDRLEGWIFDPLLCEPEA